MTRRSMKRAAASVRWDRSKLATQVPSPVKAPDVCETRRLHRPVQRRRGTRWIILRQHGLAKTPAGRAIDRTRSAPGRGFVRPMEMNRTSMHRGGVRAWSSPRARSHRDESARGIRSMCENRRAKTSASRSIGRTSPPFAQVQPRRRLNNSHDDDANEWFVRNIDETSTRMNEFTNRARESGASSR